MGLDGAQLDLVEHHDMRPPPKLAALPRAQAVAPAREAFQSHLPTGRLQSPGQRTHAMPK